MKTQLRTILLVSLVSLLIWLWAEGESLQTLAVTPRVVFVAERSDLELRTSPNWGGTVRIRIQGSTRAIHDAEAEMGAEIELRLGHPGVPSEPGDQIVSLEEAIRQLPMVKSKGLNIIEVTPPSTVVRIERLVTRELPLRTIVAPDVDLLGDPTISPTKVTIRLPEALATQLPADAFASATLSKAEIGSARDDAAQTIVSAIKLPAVLQGVDGVALTPDKANVTFRIKRMVDSIPVASVPVWVSIPPNEGAKWDIELVDQFLRDVTFTGPADAIDKIRTREFVPIAEIRLSSDDLDRGIETKQAVFVNLPPGIETGVAIKSVRVRIIKRKPDRPGAPDNLSGPDPGAAILPEQ